MRIKRGPSNRQLKVLLKESLQREMETAVKLRAALGLVIAPDEEVRTDGKDEAEAGQDSAATGAEGGKG
jgi:hypothetical protein